MKKVLLFSLLFFLGINFTYASTSTAYSYVLMDMDTGRVIESKNKDTPMLIASITKIMTAIIAIENGNLDEVITVDDSISKSYGSGIYISVGEEIKLIDLLYGLMLRSGNDAAIMISTSIAGSEEEFVKLMNKKAKKIGMKNTIFYNSSGLDNTTQGNLSTSYDMALLTKYAMKNDIYREIVGTKKYTVKTNLKTYIWYNKNKLLSVDYVTGGKTGYTEKAKRTLVSTASKNNINLIVVTIKDSDDWNTHQTLYEKIFDNYVNYKVLNKSKFKIEKDYYYDYLYIKDDVYITLKQSETYNLIAHIKLLKKDDYQNDDQVGIYYIYLDDVLIKEIPIYAKKNESKNKNIFSKIIDKLSINKYLLVRENLDD